MLRSREQVKEKKKNGKRRVKSAGRGKTLLRKMSQGKVKKEN